MSDKPNMTGYVSELPKLLRSDALEREHGLIGRSDGPAIEQYAADRLDALEASHGELVEALTFYRDQWRLWRPHEAVDEKILIPTTDLNNDKGSRAINALSNAKRLEES